MFNTSDFIVHNWNGHIFVNVTEVLESSVTILDRAYTELIISDFILKILNEQVICQVFSEEAVEKIKSTICEYLNHLIHAGIIVRREINVST